MKVKIWPCKSPPQKIQKTKPKQNRKHLTMWKIKAYPYSSGANGEREQLLFYFISFWKFWALTCIDTSECSTPGLHLSPLFIFYWGMRLKVAKTGLELMTSNWSSIAELCQQVRLSLFLAYSREPINIKTHRLRMLQDNLDFHLMLFLLIKVINA